MSELCSGFNSVSKKFFGCPYDRLKCPYFDSVSGRSECSVFSAVVGDYFRCSRLPYWVLIGNHLAVLSGGCLHV